MMAGDGCCIWARVTWREKRETAEARVWEQAAGEQCRGSALCQASPERGGWLGGGPFTGEVAGGDSLSLATSSPTHTETHTHSEGSAVQEVSEENSGETQVTQQLKVKTSEIQAAECSISTPDFNILQHPTRKSAANVKAQNGGGEDFTVMDYLWWEWCGGKMLHKASVRGLEQSEQGVNSESERFAFTVLPQEIDNKGSNQLKLFQWTHKKQ